MNEIFNLLIGDEIATTISTFYLNKARNAIKYYLNDVDIASYENQIIDLAVFYYQNRKSVGLVSQSQGSKSQSKIDGIPNEILETLPKTKIKVV